MDVGSQMKLPDERNASKKASPETGADDIELDIEELLDTHGETYARLTKRFITGEISESFRDRLWKKQDLKSAQAITNLLEKARQEDEFGNPIFFLNRYEAEAVCKLIKRLHLSGGDFNTGDWFSDVPYKIDKWLEGLDARGSNGSVKVSDERNGSQQASPDLLETERERTLDMVEAGLAKKDIPEAIHNTVRGSLERLAAQHEAIGYNEATDHTLKVIERLRNA